MSENDWRIFGKFDEVWWIIISSLHGYGPVSDTPKNAESDSLGGSAWWEIGNFATTWEGLSTQIICFSTKAAMNPTGNHCAQACKLAFGYCSLSFCGQITTTVDWLQLLDMFGNFICSYCRHNKLVGHILTGSAFLLDFLIVCATDTSWAPNRFPTCLFFFCIRRDPLGRSYRKAWGCPGVSPGITSMCPHLWSRASPNSVAWHGSSAGVSSVVLKRGWDIPELNGGLVRWENHRLLNGGYSIATFRYRRV